MNMGFVQFCVPVHVTQAAPPLPQYIFDSTVSHVVPEQHPLKQDVPLHTQALLTQACPVTHSGPVPHMQTPLVLHVPRSPQLTHAAPPVPQCMLLGGDSHVVPLQHPAPHEVALH
jgi:hypothetical protein